MASLPSPTTVPSVRGRLDEVVRRYYAPLLSFFRKRTRNSPEVPDLVQQVFLRLAQRPELDGVDNPDAYIFQTASNALKDHYRKISTRERYLGDGGTDSDATDAPSELSPERVVIGRESMARLASALRQLPERTRDVFTLRCLEGLKHAEVAELLGISVRAVEKHSAKALAYLSRALSDEGVSPR
ncbi:RNA polymerase sigma factor [Steroidobacter sp.]|uniref:RNA polymerase sigma factor n=1 Tax=Steroidobacter sp. TaxID=1978227 RepID=UPI001A566769|nr:sigma-70 family RNA polymerase sigma factor [Steroidobacter sp.]MBL8267283.1 sigma-70 family RNA polymerase sigma factor [Steroidobacter sp.]